MILPGLDSQAIVQAAHQIQAGALVSFPTETVYGLGADASNDQAVAGIFAAKGRPANHPLIVHVAEASQVSDYASSVPPFAARLIEAFWPGPLTVILPRKPGVASAAAGGQNSIGLRCPAHPVALAFLKACKTGVAGPSANRFGRVSPTTAQHVRDELGDALLVLDGSHPNLDGVGDEDVLGRFLFCGNDNLVRDVLCGGQWQVRAGRHVAQDAIAAAYKRALAQLRAL